MRTPRPSTRSGRHLGGVGTLIGNGWLRESETNLTNVAPRGWTPRSRSSLRKCMFMQMPPEVAALAAQLPSRGTAPVPAPVAAWRPIRDDDAPKVPYRRDPRKDARLIKAVDPHVMRMKAAAIDPRANERSWWEDPIALGTLLIIAPPIGLACVWRSKHYSNDARWALTVMSSLLTCFAGAVALALLFAR
jgi:nitroreductase